MLINHKDVFAFEPKEVHIFFTQGQAAYAQIVKDCDLPVYLHQELPTLEHIPPRGSLVVFDDVQNVTQATQVINQYFLKLCHHNDITGVVILQNLFDSKDRYIRSINLNASVLIIFRNIRDSLLVSHLSKQAFPGRKNILVRILNRITKNNPRGYMALYLNPDTRDDLRIRDSVFVEYKNCTIYVLK